MTMENHNDLYLALSKALEENLYEFQIGDFTKLMTACEVIFDKDLVSLWVSPQFMNNGRFKVRFFAYSEPEYFVYDFKNREIMKA